MGDVRSSEAAGAESVIVLNSSTDPEATLKFKRWRGGNKILGHYLNKSSEYGWVLHRARCGHIEMPEGSDLASHEKICARNREDIQRYAAEKCITYHRCQSCNPR